VLIVYFVIMVVRSFGSGAAPEVTVPNLTGMTREEAEHALNRVNLGLKLRESASTDAVPAAAVISQLPPAGSRVRENRQIEVICSLGRPALKVPALVGTSFAEAQKRISAGGFVLGRVEKLHLKRFRAGTVIAQTPEPNQVFTSAVKVDLTIASSDPAFTVAVPSIVGTQLYVAEKLLHNSNLRLARVTYEASPSGTVGEVVSQSPEAGAAVQPGTGVEVVVRISEELAQANACTFRFRFRLPPGLPEGKLKVEQADELGKTVVYEDSISPEETIEQVLRVQGNAVIRVYLDGILLREDRF